MSDNQRLMMTDITNQIIDGKFKVDFAVNCDYCTIVIFDQSYTPLYVCKTDDEVKEFMSKHNRIPRSDRKYMTIYVEHTITPEDNIVVDGDMALKGDCNTDFFLIIWKQNSDDGNDSNIMEIYSNYQVATKYCQHLSSELGGISHIYKYNIKSAYIQRKN